jgi:beta-aspartyl-peptidase (threonine type)
MISLIVHGGAWNIPDDAVEAHRAGVAAALAIGWNVLRSGGSSVDAVEQSLRSLEDNGTFDAGCGSHFNAEGVVELDASIMNGKTFRCGAVGAVQRVKNPITLARKIMEDSEHILLVAEGAEQFARANGIPTCDPSALRSAREVARWEAIRSNKGFTTKMAFGNAPSDTVGVVAMDEHGDLCAGTSTGGTLNKHAGRIGDSPLIGCGTYCDNAVGGVSTTGWGEGMIKVVMAKTVVDAMELNGGDPQAAAERGVAHLKMKVDGLGGVIALSRSGAFGVAFNTPRMARAYMSSSMHDPLVAV